MYVMNCGFIFITQIVLSFDPLISTADLAIAQYLHFHEKK